MDKELKAQRDYIDALYDHLIEPKSAMSREEFHKEHKDYGVEMAIYNLGFMTGSAVSSSTREKDNG
jgi:hypothetical protein